MVGRTPRLLADGLIFGEGPRWRDDRLWFSDMFDERVCAVDLDGNVETVLELPGRRPSGLGFLPDGSLLVVSTLEGEVLRLRDSELTTHADLSALVDHGCNDMVVDMHGRAYVGSLPDPPGPGVLALVEPDGSARVVAEEIDFPNGCVVTPDGTLVLAETLGKRLTEFDIKRDGSLTNRRPYGNIDPYQPDGICLDAEGAIWAATTFNHAFVRFGRGGTVLDSVELKDRFTLACALGGPDGRTLFMLSIEPWEPDRDLGRAGTLHAVEVETPAPSSQ